MTHMDDHQGTAETLAESDSVSAEPPTNAAEAGETSPPAPQSGKTGLFLWLLFALVALVLLALILAPYAESYVSDRIKVTLLHDTLNFGYDREDAGGGVLDSVSGNAVVSMDSTVSNKSLVDLHVQSITYVVYLNDSPVGRGKAKLGAKGLALNAGSESTVPIKVRFPMASAGLAEIGAILKSKQDISVRGAITASHALFKIKRRFSVTGISPDINILK